MSKKKMIIFFAAIIIAIGGLILFKTLFKKSDPLSCVEQKMGLKLTDKVDLLEGQRKVQYQEEHVKVKLAIKEGELENVQAELDKYFSQVKFRKNEGEELREVIPNFQNTCDWWDLDKAKIISGYEKMTAGVSAKTLEVWAFISSEDEKKYLYISY